MKGEPPLTNSTTRETGSDTSRLPLGLRQGLALTPSKIEMAVRLERYPLPFVEERLTPRKLTCEQYGAAEAELRKFFVLVGLDAGPLAMIGPAVDEVWHQLVLFTPQYRAFCASTVGFFVDHLPDTSSTPVPKEAGENFLTAYQRCFGELPSIWWHGMDSETEAHYRTRPVEGPPKTRWSGWTGRRPTL
jgi:hypothetical protein